MVSQRRMWPVMTYRDNDVSNLHTELFYAPSFAELLASSPDLAFAIIASVSKLVDGDDIKLTDVALEDFTNGVVEMSNKEIIHEHWFKVVKATVSYSNWNGGMGKPSEHTFVEGREGVSCVLYDTERDTFVLIEEFRIGAVYDKEPWLVGIVTGGLEPDEEPIEGAVREVIEEARIRPTEMVHMLTYKPSPGFTTHVMHAFLGFVDSTKLSTEIGGLDEEGEDIRVRVLKYSEVLAMLETNELVNGTAIIALNHFMLHKEKYI